MENLANEEVNITLFFVFLAAGLALVALSLVIRAKTGDKYELRMVHLVLLLLPVFLWLFGTGKITKLHIAGVEVEAAAQAFVQAADKPISFTPLTGDSLVDDVVATVDMARKTGVEEIPRLIEKKTEALEFQLGYGGYWGPAIEKYFATLSAAGFLRYVVIYADRNRKLFGAYAAQPLLVALQNQGDDGYEGFARHLNAGDKPAKQALRKLPGFVSASDAVTAKSNKRVALETMERLDRDFLPVVDEQQRFVGIVNRSRVTASLVLAVTSAMEELSAKGQGK